MSATYSSVPVSDHHKDGQSGYQESLSPEFGEIKREHLRPLLREKGEERKSRDDENDNDDDDDDDDDDGSDGGHRHWRHNSTNHGTVDVVRLLLSYWRTLCLGVVFLLLSVGFFVTFGLLISELKRGHKTSLQLDQLTPMTSKTKVGLVSVKYGSGTRMSHVEGIKKDPNDLYQGSIDVMQMYSDRWGYPFWVERKPLLIGPQDGGTTGMWTKEAMVLSVMLDQLRKPIGQRLEWIFWVDADVVLVNHNVPLETFLPPDTNFGRTQSLLCAVDQWKSLNSGAFLIRVSEDGLRLMTTLLSAPFVKDNEGSRWRNGEQSALAALLRNTHLREKVAVVPAHWFNADVLGHFYPQWFQKKVYQYGDFLVHFMTEHKAGWSEFLNPAMQQSNASLSLPIEQTRYMKGSDSVSSFWKEWESLNQQERIQRLTTASLGQ